MLNDEIRNAGSIVIFAHKNLDGDALGSLLALGYICKNEFCKEPILAFEGVIPDNLRFMSNKWWLKKCEDIKDVVFDLAINVDTGSIETQTDAAAQNLWANAKRKARIDHHQNSSEIGDVSIIKNASATCEIIANIALENKWNITTEIANALFVGIVTDTNWFTAEYTTPETLRTVAQLMEHGQIKPLDISYEIGEKTKQTFLNNLETLSRVLFNDTDEIGFTTFSVKYQEGNTLRPHRETGWLHKQILSVDSVKISVVFKEVDDGKVVVSMRSKDISINAFAEEMGGGGHNLAASFIHSGTIAETVAKILPKLTSFINAGF